MSMARSDQKTVISSILFPTVMEIHSLGNAYNLLVGVLKRSIDSAYA